MEYHGQSSNIYNSEYGKMNRPTDIEYLASMCFICNSDSYNDSPYIRNKDVKEHEPRYDSIYYNTINSLVVSKESHLTQVPNWKQFNKWPLW